MLIGVVGLIGSGKGTVSDRLVEKHGYQKDSFAKSLKEFNLDYLARDDNCFSL